MTSTVYRMQNMMRQCLRYYHGRPEIVNERSNWGMLHSIMVYGIDTRVLAGNRSYSAIAWIAGNNACRGQKLLTEQNGMISVKSGVGLQGHQAQMLAVFSLCDVPADYPLYAGDHKILGQRRDRRRDVGVQERRGADFHADRVVALPGYRTWSGERRRPALGFRATDSRGAGSADRRCRLRWHASIDGIRSRLAKTTGRRPTDHGPMETGGDVTPRLRRYAYRLQNRDGSMSTDWFEGREDNGDLDRKIQTTGHMVEWLLTVTPDSQLQNPRLVNAVRFLLTSMYNEREHDWQIGPKGHALRSLAMYYERVYQSGPAWQPMRGRQSQRSTRR